MNVVGIDEAGRGPVLGPMVIAGVMIDEKNDPVLKQLGVRDSKELTPARREALFDPIYSLAKEVKYVVIHAHEIDKLRAIMTLNELEAMRISEIIESFSTQSHLVYIDSPDPEEAYFSQRISKYLCSSKPTLKSEHFADKHYPSVSAASIVAKVIRDREIKKLAEQYGEIGSGYPHDESTIRFLEAWYKEMREWPECVRKSWETVKVIEDRYHQLRIGDFE